MTPYNLYCFSCAAPFDAGSNNYYDRFLRSIPQISVPNIQYTDITETQEYPMYKFIDMLGQRGFFCLDNYSPQFFRTVLVPWLDENYRWIQAQSSKKQDVLAKNNPIYFCLPIVYHCSGPYYTMTRHCKNIADKVVYPYTAYTILSFLDVNKYTQSLYIIETEIRDMKHLRASYLKTL